MWAREQDRADALHTVRSIMRAYHGDSDRDYEVGHQIDSDLSFGVYGVEFSTAWNISGRFFYVYWHCIKVYCTRAFNGAKTARILVFIYRWYIDMVKYG